MKEKEICKIRQIFLPQNIICIKNCQLKVLLKIKRHLRNCLFKILFHFLQRIISTLFEQKRHSFLFFSLFTLECSLEFISFGIFLIIQSLFEIILKVLKVFGDFILLSLLRRLSSKTEKHFDFIRQMVAFYTHW